MTNWTNPSDGGTLDLSNGTIVTETHWDNLRRDFVALGGTTGSVSARAMANANQSIANNTLSALAFGAADSYDTEGFHDTSVNNTRHTIPPGHGGKYHFLAGIQWAASATGVRQLSLRVNGGGGTILGFVIWDAVSSGPTLMQVVGDATLAAGDYVEVFCQQSSGGALNSEWANGCPFFSIVKV